MERHTHVYDHILLQGNLKIKVKRPFFKCTNTNSKKSSKNNTVFLNEYHGKEEIVSLFSGYPPVSIVVQTSKDIEITVQVTDCV